MPRKESWRTSEPPEAHTPMPTVAVTEVVATSSSVPLAMMPARTLFWIWQSVTWITQSSATTAPVPDSDTRVSTSHASVVSSRRPWNLLRLMSHPSTTSASVPLALTAS